MHLLKVSKSQKYFSSNCIAQKTSEIFDNILPQLRRAEFFQIFHSFLGQWSFNKKFFWDLLTFICSEGCIGDPLYHLSKQLGNFFRDYHFGGLVFTSKTTCFECQSTFLWGFSLFSSVHKLRIKYSTDSKKTGIFPKSSHSLRLI